MDDPIRWPVKVLLLDQAGEPLCWIPRAHAIELWRDGKVLLHLRRRKVYSVEASPIDPTVYFPRGHSTPRHYSHDHDTVDNPEGCWTLIRIPSSAQPVFLRVATDCGGVLLRRIVRRKWRPPDCLAA